MVRGQLTATLLVKLSPGNKESVLGSDVLVPSHASRETIAMPPSNARCYLVAGAAAGAGMAGAGAGVAGAAAVAVLHRRLKSRPRNNRASATCVINNAAVNAKRKLFRIILLLVIKVNLFRRRKRVRYFVPPCDRPGNIPSLAYENPNCEQWCVHPQTRVLSLCDPWHAPRFTFLFLR